MTLYQASQPDDEGEAAWLDHARVVLGAAAYLAATGTPTEVFVQKRRPMARELRSLARRSGVEVYVRNAGHLLAARFVPPGSSEEPSGPAVL
jgi:hypothetical protein